ncbi:MAG: hypothetical protein AAF092_10035 [Pseudomonadota bacterium]
MRRNTLYAAMFIQALLLPHTASAEVPDIPKVFMLWSYTYSTFGDPEKFSNRHYKTCTYVGWQYEAVTKPAKDGRCPLIHVEGPTSENQGG